MSVALSRRDFLQITATGLGGLMVSAWLPGLRAQEAATEPAWLRNALDLFIRVEPDERVIIGARSCEIGQGVRTSLPMLIAEDLDVDWAKVTVEQLPYGLVKADNEQGLDYKYGPQGAGGSTNIPEGWLELRQAGARVRHLFLQAAAKRWNTPMDSLTTDAGRVLHPDGRQLGYGELAELARTMPVSDKPLPLKSPDKFRIIGHETRVADGADVVTGRARFGIDGGIPNALVAVIARCPYFEGTLESLDDSAARAIPGVRGIVPIPGPTAKEGLVRNLAAGVAVVADDTWAALQGRKALQIKWRPAEWSGDDSNKFRESAYAALKQEGKVARRDGDAKGARVKAKRVVEAEYFQPFLAHCTMEPMNATLDLKKDSALLIASLQSPGGASRMINEMTGINRLNIEIHLPRSGGGFGRRLENDFVAETVHVAQKVKRPIKLIWTREDDLQTDWYRPSGAHGMSAFLNENNELSGWSHRVAAAARGFRQPDFAEEDPWVACLDPDAFPAGCVADYEASFIAVPFGLARGWWRGPLPTFVAFPIQSFMDEVAHAAGADPVEFRLKLLGSPRELKYGGHGGPVLDTGRMAAVLKAAAKRIGYGRKLPPGNGIGVATHFVFGGYAAHAMEVSVENGRPKIHRCVCAVDVGRVVNPLGVGAQMMGATLDGISAALRLEITVKDGKVQQQNFPDYPILTMTEAPDVEVEILRTDYPPSGAGEMGIPTSAPALVNAIFAATGKRIRRLPIADQLT